MTPEERKRYDDDVEFRNAACEHGSQRRKCNICELFCEQHDNAALRARIEELDELRKQSNCPVKYYHHGGFVSAVYGTSSIAYVEGLRARCGDVEGIRRVIYDNALANIDNIARAVSAWLKEGKG